MSRLFASKSNTVYYRGKARNLAGALVRCAPWDLHVPNKRTRCQLHARPSDLSAREILSETAEQSLKKHVHIEQEPACTN